MKFTIAKSNNPISKKFSLNKDGQLEKNDGGNLTLATFDTQNDLSISDIKNYMLSENCTDRHILIPGTCVHQDGLIVTKGEIANQEKGVRKQELVARSKDYFGYRGGAGFILLDYDPSTDYTQNDGEPLNRKKLLDILFDVIPELKTAPILWKTSSSSNILGKGMGVDGDGKKTGHDAYYRGITGQHLFVGVKNNADIKRIVEIFYKRLWLNGHGYIFIDKTGRMHDRSLIDKVVNSPEREIFIKAECTPPVYQRMEIKTFQDKKPPLNTQNISDLSAEEELRFEKMIDDAKCKKNTLADSIMEAYISKNHAKLGMSKIRLAECIKNRVLYGNDTIKMSNGVEVTIHNLFKNADKFDGQYCYDPLEPEYGGVTGGATKAWIDIGHKRIHGHAHGGIHYDLESSDRQTPRELAMSVCENKDHNILFKIAAQSSIDMRYIHTEIDQLVLFIAKFAKMKKGSCDKALRNKISLISGTSGKFGSVDVELNSAALNPDGTVADGMGQVSLSSPIGHRFPHISSKVENPSNLDTFENFEFMCKMYALKFSYDVVLKAPEISFPKNQIPKGDNHINASMSRIRSLCVLNGLGKDSVNYLIELINANQLNPVLDWVKGVEWDGKSRLQLILDNIDVATYGDSDDDDTNINFSEAYKREVVRMWFVQCVAALDGAENSPLSHKNGIAVPKYEHILVFVGGQGVQKTKFIKSLLPDDLKEYILTGHELDVKDKDNIKIAISHWITELGELDSTFRKSDISSLKAFMSKENDQMRMPYAPTESKFKRRTSYCGTVNDVRFLVDTTGNRRYLPLEVKGLLPLNQISVPWKDSKGNEIEGAVTQNDEKSRGEDVFGRETDSEKAKNGLELAKLGSNGETQQFWAEIFSYYMAGEQWWPDHGLESKLSFITTSHDRVDPTIDKLVAKFDVEKNDEWRKMFGVRGETGVNNIGENIKFATLTFTGIAVELGINSQDVKAINIISNYLRNHGIHMKNYKVDGKAFKRIRIALRKGERLLSDMGIMAGKS